MSCGFASTDHYDSPVDCSHAIWDWHITRKHPELEGQQDAVRTTLANPDHVYQSGRHSNRLLYYRRFVLPDPHYREYLLVVVAYSGRAPSIVGRILTAYSTPNIKRGDTVLWTW